MRPDRLCLVYPRLPCVMLLLMAPFIVHANSSDTIGIYGGDVHFFGHVVSSACSVSAGSQDQTVQMGQVRSDQFKAVGDWVSVQPFQIKLEDCDASVNQNVGVSFTGESDEKDPMVFRAGYGAGAALGVGIGIFDAAGNQLIPDTAPPWYLPLQAGENVLNYIARYRATSQVIKAGNADAQVWFTMVYQ